MEIQGKKIWLASVTPEDLDFICNIERDRNLWFYKESVPSNDEEVREKYLQHIEEGADSGWYDFVVFLGADQERTPIGLAQIWSYIDERQSWELGFAILPAYGGCGYGSEAADLLLQFAFNQLDAHKVVGMCNAENHRSSALMERIGMVREGIFREELNWNGQWTDQYYYCILDREFHANQ